MTDVIWSLDEADPLGSGHDDQIQHNMERPTWREDLPAAEKTQENTQETACKVLYPLKH